MINLGLIGFGRTGSIVAREIIKHAKLSCVFRKSDKYINHDIGSLLGLEEEIGVRISHIEDIEEVLDEDKPEVMIDSSSKEAVKEYIPKLAERGIGLIICSTGWTEEEIVFLKSFSDRMGIVMAPNITEGINILITLSKIIKQVWPTADIEIIETHFKQKKDVSGTAKKIAEKIGSPKIHSIRAGGIVGKHEVVFGKPHQVLRITHESIDRAAFGNGAIRAAKWLNGEKGYYTMENVLDIYQGD